MEIIVKHFDELTTRELYEILKTRFEIFVTEQECIYQDMDDKDQDAIHVFCWNDEGRVAGCLRVFMKDAEKGIVQIGRVVSGLVIIVAGIVTYVVLLYGSRIILHRQVTSELFLIIGWSMLEVASINRAIAWERVSIDRGIVFLIIVAVAAVLSLYFYLQYYKVKPMTGYFFGMVPLITEAISMGVFEFLTR